MSFFEKIGQNIAQPILSKLMHHLYLGKKWLKMWPTPAIKKTAQSKQSPIK
jgi:hypothetical protein